MNEQVFSFIFAEILKLICLDFCYFFVGLERLVEPLKSTCTMKVKANSVKQEYEKQDELKRSALRAVAALLTISDAGKNYNFRARFYFIFLNIYFMC